MENLIGTNILASIVAMTKNDLYVEILPKLVDFLSLEGIITDGEKNEIEEEIAIMHYDTAVYKLKGLNTTNQFHKIFNLIDSRLGDLAEISNTQNVRHCQVSELNKKRLYAFRYKTANLAVLPVKKIIFDSQNSAVPDYDTITKNIWDIIFLAYKNNDQELSYVWQCCRCQHEDDYFLITDQQDSPDTNWRLYAYAYLCFVNEEHIDKPLILNFNSSTPFSSTISFNSNNQYEQYFDAYNVIIESKHADDVLLRYLRMYQILEYFGYRYILAEMTKGNIRENGFVRNIISKVSGRSSNEKEEIKKALKVLLPNLHTAIVISADITQPMKDFIKDKLLINDSQHNSDFLCEVIYKLRNCIVHNKESELHFTSFNTDDYKDGIDLMRVLITKLEPAIINIINDENVKYLEFNNQQIQVY